MPTDKLLRQRSTMLLRALWEKAVAEIEALEEAGAESDVQNAYAAVELLRVLREAVESRPKFSGPYEKT